MTSRRVEDLHRSALETLLQRSGVECVRSPAVSSIGTSSTAITEEQGPTQVEEEQKPEGLMEEEELTALEEQFAEVLPEIFPTPSLRKMLPDKIRKIQEHNRIHTLPEEFITKIDPEAIPRIAVTAQQTYIDILAKLVGCKNYKSSLAEFWFLDTLANLLWRAQEDHLDKPTQAVLILWFCEWMKEIQNFDAADRKRMLRRLQDNMLSAARFIADEERLPTPAEAGVRYRAPEEEQALDSTSPSKFLSGLQSVYFEGAAYGCALTDLVKIIHYIYDLFSSDYQFDLIRSIFTESPDYSLLEAPYQIQNPKRLYAPLKLKPRKEPKKEAKPKGKKGKEVDTEEYLALMELKAREQRELDELEDLGREQWNRKSHILPLAFAVTEELFDKYWPPPTPEPEAEPVPEPKGKGKKKDDKKK